MKVKTLTGIVIVVLLGTVIMSTSRSENIAQQKEESFPEQVERIASKNLDQKPDNKPTISEWNHQPINPTISLKELAGHVNKEYGIREDILRYIEKEIPPNNEMAKKAAIKYAQASQFIYYKATQEEAIKAVTKKLISLDCLRYALKGDEDPIAVPKYIAKLMRNTPERDKHMWYIDEHYFGWKVLGYGDLSTEQILKMCENGDY